MNSYIIYKLIGVIVTIMSGSLSNTLDVRPLHENQNEQSDDFLDIQNMSRKYQPKRLNSNDILLYDKIFEKHTILTDFLLKNGNAKNRHFEMEINGSQLRNREPNEGQCKGLCKTSMCPWTLEVDRDSNRIPENIEYARCLSRTCHVNFPALPSWVAYRIEMLTYCDTLRKDIYVTINGKGEWLYNWPIACVCARVNIKERDLGKYLRKIQAEEKSSLRVKTVEKDNESEVALKWQKRRNAQKSKKG